MLVYISWSSTLLYLLDNNQYFIMRIIQTKHVSHSVQHISVILNFK